MEQEFEVRAATVTASLFTLSGREYAAFTAEGLPVVAPGEVFRALFRPRDGQCDKPLVSFTRPTNSVESHIQRMREQQELAPADVLAMKQRGEEKPRRAKKGVDDGRADLSRYPEAMRHPLAESQRTVWDALAKPCGMEELAERTKMSSPSLYSVLSTMRNRCLAHKRDSDGRWERTTEEAAK